MEKIITKIPITPPGVMNRNGIAFDPDSYIEVMNSERTKEMIKNKTFFLVDTINIDLKHVIGTIINWTPEYIEVEMDNQEFADYIIPLGKNCIAGIIGRGEFIKYKLFKLSDVDGFQLLTGKYGNVKR